MCTMIAKQVQIDSSEIEKGGWFKLMELYPEAARSLVKTIQTILDEAQVGGDLD